MINMANILCILFMLLFSIDYLSLQGLIQRFFDAVGAPEGMRTLIVAGLMLVVSSVVYVRSSSKFSIAKEVFKLSIVWLPFLIYMALRCDFSDPYSVRKLGLTVGVLYSTLIFLSVVYLDDPERFDKFFYLCTIFICFFLFAHMIVDPNKEIYNIWANRTERVTVESINPNWLSRSFAFASLCSLLFKNRAKYFDYIGFVLFIPGIIITGSRGPLMSLLIVAGLVIFFKLKSTRRGALTGFVLLCLSVPVVVLALAHYDQAIHRYFQRGTNKSMFVESGRLSSINQAMLEFYKAPFLGHGLGKWGTNYGYGGVVTETLGKKRFVQNYPHNLPAEILAELGLFGFVLFVLALRPGWWMFDTSNKYSWLFLLSLLFSLSSGDITGNTGVFIFGFLARLASEKHYILFNK